MNPPDPVVESPPKRRIVRRQTRLARLMMVFGIASTGTVLLCCISTLAFPLKMTTEPAEVRSIALKFAPVKVPENFVGAEGMSADNSMMWVQIARFEQTEGRGQLVIGDAHVRSFMADEKSDAKWFEWLIDKLAPGLRLLDVQQKHEKTIEIRGKLSVFEIVEGEDRASTTRFKQVTGSFPGPAGTAKLILQAETDFLTDQAIDDLLQSLSQESGEPRKGDANLNSK